MRAAFASIHPAAEKTTLLGNTLNIGDLLVVPWGIRRLAGSPLHIALFPGRFILTAVEATIFVLSIGHLGRMEPVVHPPTSKEEEVAEQT